jgi:hypothetical protein
MADEEPITAPALPKVGDRMRLPVRVSPSRQILTPDNLLVAVGGPNLIEVIMLRAEIVLEAQSGSVKSVSDNGNVEMELQPGELRPQIYDIGHLRLTGQTAVDMALNLIQVASTHISGVEGEEVMQRLRVLLTTSK